MPPPLNQGVVLFCFLPCERILESHFQRSP
uniref:Uncharacterized protein n=1 Tax=Anguilla anguilla TaxID=7936 RepID=A0A0E9QWY0_ANGAN